MKFENMNLEQLIDNEVNVGEHISMDDILDNVVEENSADKSGLVLNEVEGDKVVKGLANDRSISEEYWDRKVQHIWDDLCYQLNQYGSINVDEVAAFHGIVVYSMINKYL